MIGPGRYDAELGKALLSAGARQGILIVLDSASGTPSFCCRLSKEVAPAIPNLLRVLANSIEEDVKKDLKDLEKQQE